MRIIVNSLLILALLVQAPSCFALSQSASASIRQFPLEAALMDYENLPRSLDSYDYSKEYFKIRFLTPPSGYRYALKNKEKAVIHKLRRKKKDGLSLEDDDLSEMDFWDYRKPYVTALIISQPQTRNIAKLGRYFGYTFAFTFTIMTLGIGMATMGLPGKIGGYKVSKDFSDAKIMHKKEVVCSTVDKDISLMSDLAQKYFFPDDHFERFHNKLYMGKFAFKPECFNDLKKRTKLVLFDKKGRSVYRMTISKALKKNILKDFEYMINPSPLEG